MASHPGPNALVMIGLFLIALVNVSAAHEPSASLMMPFEELAREGSYLLPAPAPGGCSVSLPKLGLPVSNSTAKTFSPMTKCASSTTTKKAGASSSITTKAAVKTSTTLAVAPKTSLQHQNEEVLDAWDPLQDDWKDSSAFTDDLEPPLANLRDDVEQACTHHDEHDKKVVCMVHEVLRMRGQVEPLSVEKDGNKVQVVSMLQEDQVVFEDEMDDVSLLLV